MKRYIPLLVLLPLIANSQVKLKHTYDRGNPVTAKYSSNQSLLVVAEKRKLSFYVAGSTTLSKEIAVQKGIVVDFDLHTDNRHVVVATSDGLILVDQMTSAVVHQWSSDVQLLKVDFLEGMNVAAITDESLIIYDFEASTVKSKISEHNKAIRVLSVSKDGKHIATGGGDGNIVLYNASTGEVAWKRKIHDSWVRSLAFSYDGKTIASGDDSGKIYLTPLNNEDPGRLLTTTRSWVTALGFSADSKYLSAGDVRGNILLHYTENGLLHAKLSNSNTPVTSLYFSDDGKELVVLEQEKSILVYNSTSLNITPVFNVKNDKDINPPQIFVADPPNIQDNKVRIFHDVLELRGVVMDDAGVRSLRINGIDTPLKNNNNFVIFLPLSPGDNAVSIEARDINDNIALKKFVVNRKNLDGEDYDPSKARNYLFVVGIDDYESWPKLHNAVKDASDVVSVLMSEYRFAFDHLSLLKNEQATRANIYRSLRSLIEKITPQDNLIIYYSGHGYFDELLNEGYWIPVDAKPSSTGDYLSNTDILKLVGSINSQHTFLVADACFSGALFGISKRGYAENVERFKSRWGLTSGRLEAVSDGAIGKNSPFASALIQFLDETPKEKFVVSDLIQFVKQRVPEISDQTPIGNPLLVAGEEGGEFVFYRK